MSLRHALLGFLSLRPLTGYDLKKYFDASVRHFWTADQAQIYRELARLSEQGLLDVRVISQGSRPARKEHRITVAGLAELDHWLAAPDEPAAVREPFLVKVFFAGRLPVAEVTHLLDERIAAARQQLDQLQAIAATTTEQLAARPPALERLLAAATLENGIRHVATEIDWLGDLRADLADVNGGVQRIRRRLDPSTTAATGEP